MPVKHDCLGNLLPAPNKDQYQCEKCKEIMTQEQIEDSVLLKTLQSLPSAYLYNYSWHEDENGGFLRGRVLGHPKLLDHNLIFTSSVQLYDKAKGLAITENTVYKLLDIKLLYAYSADYRDDLSVTKETMEIIAI